MSCGSTHVFPFAGPIDPQCAICRKTRSQIQREDEDARLEAEYHKALEKLVAVGYTHEFAKKILFWDRMSASADRFVKPEEKP